MNKIAEIFTSLDYGPAPESADGRGALEVTISGRPVELAMHAHGRTAHARVTLGGPDEALAALAAAG